MKFDNLPNRKNTNSIKWDFVTYMYPDLKHEVLPLWVADMDFPCSDEILKGLHERVETQIFGYSKFDNEYYEILKKWFSNHYGYSIENENITFSPGIVPALGIAVRSLTTIEDSVLIQPPVYYPFKNMIVNNGRKLVENHLLRDENGYYTIDFEDLDKKLALPEVKMMIFCSPHNPVGRVWKAEEVEKVVELCAKHNVYLISDEIHCDLIREGIRFTSVGKFKDKIADKLIICTAPSKSFNLAGLNLSNIITFNNDIKNKFIDELANKMAVSMPSPFSISATKAAYSKGEEWLADVNKYIDDNLKFMKEFIDKNMPSIKYNIPEGTYLAWMDFSDLPFSDEEITDRLLNVAKVALDEGKIFGRCGEKHQRINVACPRSILEEALNKIKLALEF